MTTKHPSTAHPSNPAAGESAPTQAPNNAAADLPNPPAHKPRTGVSRYDPEFAVLICERIATTPGNLASVCRHPDMPALATIYRWLRAHPEFREIYADAKQAQAEFLIHEAFEIADDKSEDYKEKDGKITLNREAIQRSKMRIELRKWMAAKQMPRKYGNRLEESPDVSSRPETTSQVAMPESLRLQLIERRRLMTETPPADL